MGTGTDWTGMMQHAHVVDGSGMYLTPGFIDLHCHGGGGHSNEDGDQAILGALSAHHAHGTTRLVASFVTNPLPELIEHLRTVARMVRINPLLLGSHLEGPYLCEERKGAHAAAHLTSPDAEDIQQLLDAAQGTLRQITLDPDRPGTDEAIRQLVSAGVRVAIGHTEATFDATREAFAEGATMLTHTFNAMPGIHHRDPGPIMAAIETPEVFLELILDNEHVHPGVAALLLHAASGRVALITDAMAAAAGPDGNYKLGMVPVSVLNRRAMVSGTDALAGSTLTLDEALRNAIKLGLPAHNAVEAVTLTPARALGLERQFGLLKPGHAADFVLLDRGWNVVASYALGTTLYERSK